MHLLLLLACGSSQQTPEPAPDPLAPLPVQEDGRILLPAVESPTGVFTRFAGHAEFMPTSEQAFELRRTCPELTWVSLDQSTERFSVLTVQGDRLENTVAISVLKPDNSLATAKHHALVAAPGQPLAPHQQGAIEVPLACDDCMVFFGVELTDGSWAACRGPGYAVQLSHGAITAATGT